MKPMRANALPLVLVSLLALTPACGRQGPPGGVVLIVLDTARADHLSCYGYARPTSPWIDAFAAHATQYDLAIAPGSWTLPSHASMFTGKHPFEHGAHRTDAVSELYENAIPLDESHFTLAEAFAAEGFVTAAFAANDGYLDVSWQLDQGFQTYQVINEPAVVLNERIFAWLDTLSTDRFFLFVNYMDAHHPYNTTPVEGVVPGPVSQDKLLRRYLISLVRRTDGAEPTPDLVASVVGQYDTGIANADVGVGALLDRLQSWGKYEDATIIVTSDHGEAFNEHHIIGHGFDVYQPEIWVPLIVKAPRQQDRRRVHEPISLSDLPRLIFSLMARDMGKKYAAEFPNAPGAHPLIAQNYFTGKGILDLPGYGARFRRARTAVIDGSLKLIDSTDGTRELYDLAEDPWEADDRLAHRRQDGERLAASLARYRSTRPDAPAGAEPLLPDKEHLEKLKALGYMGN